MNGGDPLDALLDALRRPASPSELAGESRAVDAVTASVRSTKGSSMRLRTNSRKLRAASFVAAGVIGFGGVAAAGPAVVDRVAGDDFVALQQLDEPPLTTVTTTVGEPPLTMAATADEPEVTTVTTTAPSDPDGDAAAFAPNGEGDGPTDGADGVPLVDDPDTAFDERNCAPGNHGRTVSSVAKETPSGPGKGEIVSEAAQSTCGKKDKDDKKSDDSEDAEPDDRQGEPEEDDGHGKPDKGEKPDRGDKPNKRDKPEKKEKPGKAGKRD